MPTREKPEAVPEKGWWLHRQGETYGPYDRNWILKQFKEAKVDSADLFWNPLPEKWCGPEDEKL